MSITEPIRDKATLRQLADYFLIRGQLRNHALLIVGVHTALRVSDLLGLRWRDVYDEDQGAFRSHITLREKKTGKPKIIALNRYALKALRLYFPDRRGEYIFVNRV